MQKLIYSIPGNIPLITEMHVVGKAILIKRLAKYLGVRLIWKLKCEQIRHASVCLSPIASNLRVLTDAMLGNAKTKISSNFTTGIPL